MKATRKFLSCVLAFAMMLSCFGINAYAAATDDLVISNFSLDITNTDNTLSVALICDKGVSAWGGSVGYMSITDGNGADASTYFTLNTITNAIGDPNNDLAQKKWSASANDYTNGDTLTAGAWTTYTYTVAESVPDGNYTFTMTFAAGECFDVQMEDYSISGQSVTATYTVGSTPAVEGYTAQVTADAAVTVGQNVNVYVGVGHNSDSTFHAAEIVLNYDASKLELVTASLDSNQQIKYTNVNGVLTIENFDEEHNMGTGVYTIQFKANVVGETAVTLSSAKFLHKSVAHSSNLIRATINPDTATIQVKKATVKVSQTEGSVGIVNLATETPVNEAFTFSVSDSNLYVYTVTATVGGNAAAVTDNKDGTYTIAENLVTDDIVITASRTGREFDVEWAGEGANDVTKPEGKPTYGADYVFTVPTNIKETATTPGYTYSASVSIVGSEFSLSGAAGQTVTIPGAQIIGKVTINVTKTEVPANGKTVSITGQDVKFESGETTVVVSPGTELTLVLTPEAGYTYEVKVDGQAVTLTDNKYTIAVGDKDIAVTVTKTLDTETLNVGAYVTLNSQAGEKLWLVTFDPTLASDKIPTYDGANMFWSAKYDAYCFLVQAVSLDVDIAAGKLGVATATADEVDYSGDVNRTTETDAADAQFVANMYNAMYDGVSDDVTMAMFLSADMDGNSVLNIEDAKTIILVKVLKSTN